MILFSTVCYIHMLNTCDKPSRIIMTTTVLLLVSLIIAYYYSVTTHVSIYAQELLLNDTNIQGSDPYITDPNFTVEAMATGLEIPTDMAFLSDDVILVLEKNNGTVRKVVNGTVLQEPILDVTVATKDERVMLGIDVAQNIGYTYVFLYYTEAKEQDGEDLRGIEPPLGNRLYRYELDNNGSVTRLSMERFCLICLRLLHTIM
jgi:glucose/arabinose dehydrogenase